MSSKASNQQDNHPIITGLVPLQRGRPLRTWPGDRFCVEEYEEGGLRYVVKLMSLRELVNNATLYASDQALITQIKAKANGDVKPFETQDYFAKPLITPEQKRRVRAMARYNELRDQWLTISIDDTDDERKAAFVDTTTNEIRNLTGLTLQDCEDFDEILEQYENWLRDINEVRLTSMVHNDAINLTSPWPPENPTILTHALTTHRESFLQQLAIATLRMWIVGNYRDWAPRNVIIATDADCRVRVSIVNMQSFDVHGVQDNFHDHRHMVEFASERARYMLSNLACGINWNEYDKLVVFSTMTDFVSKYGHLLSLS